MTYKRFHKAWQEIPDKFFQFAKECIYDNSNHEYRNCPVAEFIIKFVLCNMRPNNFRAERHCCCFCWLRIQDCGIKNTDDCFNEFYIILNNQDMHKVRLLAHAVFARERLRNINTREWYDFIQERNKNDTERNSAMVE